MNVLPIINLGLNERQVVVVGGNTIVIDFIGLVTKHVYVDVGTTGLQPITVCVDDETVYE